MSQRLISLSPDLQRLRDEGYDIRVVGGYLVLDRIPYLNHEGRVLRGTLVSELTLAGDVTTTPSTHVVYFSGEYPCGADGQAIEQIRYQSHIQTLAGLVVHHAFSSKPAGGYPDYFLKMSTYAAILSGPACSADPSVSCASFSPVVAGTEESVFNYIDTASSRAQIEELSARLSSSRVAIVGLGGTGSYVLDLLAKTPVKEIHLFDGDVFSQHNAFRSPGAPTLDELRARYSKVEYFEEKYSQMHRGLVTHHMYLDETSVEQLEELDFVFICVDSSLARRHVVSRLISSGVAFIDVGMGVELSGESLGGILRVTTCTSACQDAHTRIPLDSVEREQEYARNIQIADLNALNAALAVIRWKKLMGFYSDLEQEHFSAYMIDGNCIVNEVKPCAR